MTAKPNLEGRRALVTGAGSGIGLAVSKRLSELGATVSMLDRSQETIRAAAESVGAEPVWCDLTRSGDVHTMLAAHDAVDILVNNAGFQHVAALEDFPENVWNEMHAVMLTAPFLLMRHFLPFMYGRGWGRVINVASVHGLVGSPFKSAYVAAKHGLLGLTKVAALEAGARSPQVTVTAVCPSYVRTPLVEHQIADQAAKHDLPESDVMEQVLLSQNAIRRLIEPTDVAATVAFLCTDEAWSFTGGAITMDAGWLAH